MQKVLHGIVGRYETRSIGFYIKYNKFDIISQRKFLGIPFDIKYSDDIIYQTPDGEKTYTALLVECYLASIDKDDDSIYSKIEINPNDFHVYDKPHFYTRKRAIDCLSCNVRYFNSTEAMMFYIKYNINKYQLMPQPRMFLYGKV